MRDQNEENEKYAIRNCNMAILKSLQILLTIFFLFIFFNNRVQAEEQYKIYSYPTEENKIIVTENKLYGLTDKDNNIIIEPIYTKIRSYGDNSISRKGEDCYKKIIFSIELNNKYGIADTKGNILYNPEFDSIYWVGPNNMIQCRYLKIEKNNKFAIFDIHKKTLGEFLYDNIKVSSDTIFVTIDGKTTALYPQKAALHNAATIVLLPVTIAAMPIIYILSLLAII